MYSIYAIIIFIDSITNSTFCKCVWGIYRCATSWDKSILTDCTIMCFCVIRFQWCNNLAA